MNYADKAFAGAPFQLQASNRDIDFSRLPPFLRVLLTTDGTVTSSLEAYFWEAVAVDTLNQCDITLSMEAPEIDCRVGDHVLKREVQLRGCDSQRIFARAESMIKSELLSPQFRADLMAERLGVGELLRECGLETYREVLSVSLSGAAGQINEVQRSYRIVMEHKPFISITEHFPIALY